MNENKNPNDRKERESSLRILAAADLHGDSDIANYLARKAEKEKVDLVVLCGDVLGWVETQGLIKPFKEKGKRVLIVPGNHESFATIDFVASLYDARNLHGYAVIYNGVGFFGAGGADLGPGTITEEQLMETLEKAHSMLQGVRKKVMITHMHPRGSKSEFSGVAGSESIRKAIKRFKPDLHIHGHIHEAGGIEEIIETTKVVNVSKRGKVIEI
ncbi:hypothetical protein D6817_05100 [Candidatus Pacearchaeota archaeon]|nr:MAG: hypothetical protein D6817_05100 [Candidatus Pacearchaeota archaeon]